MENEVEVTAQVPYIGKLQPGETFAMNVPECCREGWDDCPHVTQPIKKTKRNIGL